MAEEHPKQKGIKTEAILLSELVKRDLTVLTPFGDNERYDFVVEVEGIFHRVQVKTGRWENGGVVFETRSTGIHTYKTVRDTYQGDADLFGVYSYEEDTVYMVPVHETGSSQMKLRVDDPGINSPNINWADDYTLDSWIEGL
ncbi:MAG: group I intron-associated PD-(D/E)XK endonuclease [Halobacteria archaeon]|nr:group I intron-associated PD-(D/E)XK endonuclease [Halobacteria archaeon]